MKRLVSFIRTNAVVVALCPAFLAPTHATIAQGESGGLVTSITLEISDLVSASNDFGQLDATSPPPYSEMDTLIDLTAAVGVVEVQLFAQTGTGEIFANSNVDGNPGLREVDANATVFDGFSFSAVSVPTFDTLVSVSSATLIASTAEVTGSSALDIGSTGDSDLLDLTIAIDGIPRALGGFIDLSGNATPNTDVPTGVAGLTITLNEQIDVGDNVTTFGIQVNAIHLAFDGVAVPGLIDETVNGDVYISQTYALATIPEPSSLLLLGCPILCTLIRRRR
jgi:hypothetical protein